LGVSPGRYVRGPPETGENRPPDLIVEDRDELQRLEVSGGRGEAAGIDHFLDERSVDAERFETANRSPRKNGV
jgi:hypothetical protein